MPPASIVKLTLSAQLPSASLGPAIPVAEPLGAPVAQTRNLPAPPADANASYGVWECSPGRWRRQVLKAEFSHILSGRCRFVPDVGEPVVLRGGDSVYFPPDSHGVWEIEQTLRKVYVVFDAAAPAA